MGSTEVELPFAHHLELTGSGCLVAYRPPPTDPEKLLLREQVLQISGVKTAAWRVNRRGWAKLQVVARDHIDQKLMCRRVCDLTAPEFAATRVITVTKQDVGNKWSVLVVLEMPMEAERFVRGVPWQGLLTLSMGSYGVEWLVAAYEAATAQTAAKHAETVLNLYPIRPAQYTQAM